MLMAIRCLAWIKMKPEIGVALASEHANLEETVTEKIDGVFTKAYNQWLTQLPPSTEPFPVPDLVRYSLSDEVCEV